jgi:hypothetical protein
MKSEVQSLDESPPHSSTHTYSLASITFFISPFLFFFFFFGKGGVLFKDLFVSVQLCWSAADSCQAFYTSPGVPESRTLVRHGDSICTVAPNILGLHYETCFMSGTYHFELAPRFLENVYTSVLKMYCARPCLRSDILFLQVELCQYHVFIRGIDREATKNK